MLLNQQVSSNLSLGKDIAKIPLQQYEAGEEIPVLDSGIWQVYRGVVQLSRIQIDGSDVIVGWAASNSVFGNGLNSQSIPYMAVALTDVYVRHYTPQNIVKDSLLARQLLTQSSDRLIQSQRLLAIVAIRKVEDRLKALLSLLKQEIGQPTDDGVRLQVRFTHQHLAESIRTTRVTVTRTLGDLIDQGLICLDKEEHIIVQDC